MEIRFDDISYILLFTQNCFDYSVSFIYLFFFVNFKVVFCIYLKNVVEFGGLAHCIWSSINLCSYANKLNIRFKPKLEEILKCHFTGLIFHLWLLHYFCLLFCRNYWALMGRTWKRLHLGLSSPKSLTLCILLICGSLY